MNNVKTVKKITMRDLLEVPKGEDSKEFFLKLAKADKNGTEIAAISGEITGYAGKSGQYGESFFFIGMFAAQNRLNGEVQKSGKIYLPKDVTENLIAMFNKRAAGDEGITFQLVCSVVQDNSGAGYTYLCEPIRNPEIINKEARILGVFNTLPAIAAPKAHKKIA